jgi:hypothetical protein
MEQTCRQMRRKKGIYPDAFAASIHGRATQGGSMDEYLRTRIDEYFDSGFGKTTGIDHALEIIKIYAGSAAADPDKIPKLFQTLVEQFEPREKDRTKDPS